MKKGNLIIISGPSGVGKSTIRKRLINENNNFKYSVSMTTRTPRIDEDTNLFEKDGDEYHFVSKKEFLDNIKNNKFLEYAEVYNGIYYGTLKDDVEEKLNNGFNVILEIDVDGAIKIKEKENNAILIFIKPKDIAQLEKRLRKRGNNDEEEIKKRLNKALYEINKSIYYDYIIESKSKEEDYANIKKILSNI